MSQKPKDRYDERRQAEHEAEMRAHERSKAAYENEKETSETVRIVLKGLRDFFTGAGKIRLGPNFEGHGNIITFIPAPEVSDDE